MRSGSIRFSPSMFFCKEAFTQTFCGGGEVYPGMVGGSGCRAVKAAPIKRKLPCSLEELCKGSTKKMKMSREIVDASGVCDHNGARKYINQGVLHEVTCS